MAHLTTPSQVIAALAEADPTRRRTDRGTSAAARLLGVTKQTVSGWHNARIPAKHFKRIRDLLCGLDASATVDEAVFDWAAPASAAGDLEGTEAA